MLRLVALAAAALHCSAAADCISVPRRPNCVWWRSGSTPRSKAAKKKKSSGARKGAAVSVTVLWPHSRNATQGLGDIAPSGPCTGGWHSPGVLEKPNPSLLAEGRCLCPLPWAGGGDSLSHALADVTTCLAKCTQLQEHRVLSVFASQWHHKAPAKSKPDTLCRISCTGWAQLCREKRGRQQRRGKFLFQGH